ncbi:hypothetical protein CNMCM5623_001043 [Aspergillus felis]|uniref:CCHC-type domain-containing protein n=1 Tax=Aspergillus felis TaxID=1287682 RepID=A0A8H6Q669_9EURO|nr:hypothetical protein CNMCM5623_001043 [Aspergillus felis]
MARKQHTCYVCGQRGHMAWQCVQAEAAELVMRRRIAAQMPSQQPRGGRGGFRRGRGGGLAWLSKLDKRPRAKLEAFCCTHHGPSVWQCRCAYPEGPVATGYSDDSFRDFIAAFAAMLRFSNSVRIIEISQVHGLCPEWIQVSILKDFINLRRLRVEFCAPWDLEMFEVNNQYQQSLLDLAIGQDTHFDITSTHMMPRAVGSGMWWAHAHL